MAWIDARSAKRRRGVVCMYVYVKIRRHHSTRAYGVQRTSARRFGTLRSPLKCNVTVPLSLSAVDSALEDSVMTWLVASRERRRGVVCMCIYVKIRRHHQHTRIRCAVCVARC